MEGLKIGDLAGRSGFSRDAIRFYERVGLLPRPRRSAAQYRLYGDGDERRLHFIRRAQGLGLTLDDIRALLSCEQPRTPGQCRRVAALLRKRIAELDRKLAEVKAFRRHLAESLERCEQMRADPCPVILDLNTVRRKG